MDGDTLQAVVFVGVGAVFTTITGFVIEWYRTRRDQRNNIASFKLEACAQFSTDVSLVLAARNIKELDEASGVVSLAHEKIYLICSTEVVVACTRVRQALRQYAIICSQRIENSNFDDPDLVKSRVFVWDLMAEFHDAVRLELGFSEVNRGIVQQVMGEHQPLSTR